MWGDCWSDKKQLHQPIVYHWIQDANELKIREWFIWWKNKVRLKGNQRNWRFWMCLSIIRIKITIHHLLYRSLKKWSKMGIYFRQLYLMAHDMNHKYGVTHTRTKMLLVPICNGFLSMPKIRGKSILFWGIFPVPSVAKAQRISCCILKHWKFTWLWVLS